ncbi:MAG: hypothetical protein ACAH27_05565 [Xanthobacteraceae bacterium]
MAFTITIGWWALPAIFTILALACTRMFGPRMSPANGGMFPDIGGALAELACYAFAIIGSLIAWLIWAVLT